MSYWSQEFIRVTDENLSTVSDDLMIALALLKGNKKSIFHELSHVFPDNMSASASRTEPTAAMNSEFVMLSTAFNQSQISFVLGRSGMPKSIFNSMKLGYRGLRRRWLTINSFLRLVSILDKNGE